MVAAMPDLLRSAKMAVEKGLAQGRNESYVKQLSDYIIPALVEALHKVQLVHADCSSQTFCCGNVLMRLCYFSFCYS